jgi:adenine-specific DNA-methyltransferase
MKDAANNAVTISPVYDPLGRVILHHGEALGFLRTVPSGVVRLVVTSPPYNLGKQYEVRQSLDAYLKEQEPALDELVRVLAADGSICWQVGNHVAGGEVFPLDILFYDLFKKRGLRLRNRIVWHFGHGLHAARRLSGRYETILWFTKGDDYVFNLDPIRVPSKYPGKTHFKGPRRGDPSGNPLGKNPSDVWQVVADDWERGVWDIPNVKANHPEKTPHPCQFPVELVERCVLALSNEGDLVYDPYCGVGSSIIAALHRGRRGMGSEKDAEYVRVARERVAAFLEGRLKIRPLGKPVHQPTGREKVARVPAEWRKKEKRTRERDRD